MLKENSHWKCAIKAREGIKSGRKEECNKQKAGTNFVDTNEAISIITSNVSGLNRPTNRQRCQSEFFFFLKKIQVLVVYKKHFKYEDTDILKLKE